MWVYGKKKQFIPFNKVSNILLVYYDYQLLVAHAWILNFITVLIWSSHMNDRTTKSVSTTQKRIQKRRTTRKLLVTRLCCSHLKSMYAPLKVWLMVMLIKYNGNVNYMSVINKCIHVFRANTEASKYEVK